MSFRPQVDMILTASLARFRRPLKFLKTGSFALAVFAAAVGMGSRVTEAAGPRGLFKGMATGQPDTLEVFVIYVQFNGETTLNDETTTTGLGTFGSDRDKNKYKYSLDPDGDNIRLNPAYLRKHFDFARDYFDKVSGGRVVIVPRIFEEGGLAKVVTLPKPMKYYNPSIQDKSAKQKTKDFEETQALQLMSFVSLAAHGAMSGDAKDPFLTAFKEDSAAVSPHKKRAFLLFHAGHSRLVDGGSLGYLGANTPNDFTDFFVTKDYFKALAKAKGQDSTQLRRDSLGVVTSKNDTVSQFMMLSETASQDGINWGINGILVNQLGRQMGMPDLFDVVQGISQVGYFDVMDFAGYNTMNGFLPVFPSAWIRSYMGWDEPVVAKAGTGAFSDYSLYAADQPGAGRTRTVKIPLNDREYLLVENRQRAARDGNVTINLSKASNPDDKAFTKDSSFVVPYAALDSIFLDSVCTAYSGSSCTKKDVNPRKPSGVITGASNYDMGLPGNGLLVWHVNEWWIEKFIGEGAINFYAGDTLRSQYKGLELTEADGVPSIGKQFTDPLGQPAFDYGTGRDMLPNIYRKRVNPPKDTSWAGADTISVIGSYGFANTNSWNDGRTHIQLQALIPASPVVAKGVSSFSGDSVFTLRDSAITLRVVWPDNNTIKQPAGSVWPVRTASAGNPQALNLLRDGSGRRFVVSAADSGLLQTYTNKGVLALAARDSVSDTNHYEGVTTFLSSGNAKPTNAAAVNSLVNPAGAPLGVAVASDSILVVLTGNAVRFVRARADSLNGSSLNGGRDTTIALKGMVGPLVWGGSVFVIDSTGTLHGFNPVGGAHMTQLLPAANYQSMAGIKVGSANRVIAAGRTTGASPLKGAATLIDPVALTADAINLQWGNWTGSDSESFSIAVSDIDRDGGDDAFILGSRGSALLFQVQTNSGNAFSGWPQRLPRSVVLSDTLGSWVTEERSAPALTDLDRDGHPDIVFSGSNGVYAIDWHGATLPGWPFRLQPRQEVGFTYSNRTLLAGVIGSSPLALRLNNKPAVLIASPDGLIYAIDSAGKKQSYSSFDPATKKETGVLMSDLSDWPISTGGLSLDSSRSPYVNIALLPLDSSTGARALVAQTAVGGLNVWTLTGSVASAADWSLPGGDAGRSFRLDAEALGAPVTPGASEAIQEFHLFPSPLRGGMATVHLRIGTAATRARIRVFDLSGRMVKDETLTGLNPGLQPYTHVLDLRNLGPDVYSVMCEVSFTGGKKTTWQRLGVVK